MINISAYTSPNRSDLGAIHNLDLFEQVFDAYHISSRAEASESFLKTENDFFTPKKTSLIFSRLVLKTVFSY